MNEKKEKPIVIELYELWNTIKARFSIVSPQPRSFTLLKTVQPTISLDGYTVEFIDLTDDTAVAAAGSNVQLLTPPDGFVYEVVSVRGAIPAIAAATGTHYLDIFHSHCGLTGESILSKNGANGAAIYMTPATIAASSHMMVCGHSETLVFRYANGSDTTQAGTRILHVIVKKRVVGA